MNWLASIGVGLLSAPLVGLAAGTAAVLAVEWLRVSSREGAAGFFAVAITILSSFAGFVLGILFARGVLLSAPSFGKALGLTVATGLVVSLLALGLARLVADIPPRMDGRPLDLAIELRCPPGTRIETVDKSLPLYASLIRLSDGEHTSSATLELEAARTEEGRQIIPATLRIQTSAAKKLLGVRIGEQIDLLFELDFGARPQEKDLQWSRWIDATQTLGLPRPPTDARFAVRTQVRKVEPPPPPPTREQQDAAEEAKQEAAMRALPPDATLAQWLIFTRYGAPQARIAVAAAAIRDRPDFTAEMTREMLDGEHDSSRDALRAIEHIQPPPVELADSISAVGREIAQSIRDIPPSSGEMSEQYSHGADISTRFSAWMVATRALQGKNGVDFVPVLQEIIEPARKHEKSYVLQVDVVRVASFYLHKWGGIEPLPTDPPPR